MRVERTIDRIPEKATSLPPVGFRDKLHVWHGLRRLLKPAMYSALLTVTATSLILGCSTTPESRIVTQVKAITTPTPISDSTPEPSATTVPPATATKEPTTPTLPPTLTPEPSATTAPATPTRTPTAEATPIPKPPEKSPLPVYSVYMGNLFNEETGAKGTIMLASIPQKKGDQVVDQVAIFWQEKHPQYEKYSYGAYPLELETVEDNSFKAISSDNRPRWAKGTFTVEASWDKATQTLNGTFTTTTRPGGQLKVTIRSFKAEFTGTGKAKVLETAKKTKQAQGFPNSNWTNIRVDEFEREITLPSDP